MICFYAAFVLSPSKTIVLHNANEKSLPVLLLLFFRNSFVPPCFILSGCTRIFRMPLDKHLMALLRYLSFFLNNMTAMANKNLQKAGIIGKVKYSYQK
jgi:hypothetical protein